MSSTPLITYDIETYPNVFLMACHDHHTGNKFMLEVSDFKDDRALFHQMVQSWVAEGYRMVGFNNERFDYPVIHELICGRAQCAADLYKKAMAIIDADWTDWSHFVRPGQRRVPQIDLYKIHHFDNINRATSLKVLEFNMQMERVKELPFPVGTTLCKGQAEILREYNWDDINATDRFLEHTMPMIEFRDHLTHQYKIDCTNFNDTKIGKQYFAMRLEQNGVELYDYGKAGRTVKQTKRPEVPLSQCIAPYVNFVHPEFKRVLNYMRSTTIKDTRKAPEMKDLSATVKGFTFDYGLGGIHGSITNTVLESDEDNVIVDVDVTSYYPSLAITNNLYPLHLGETFSRIYADIRDQRVHFPKGTPENAMLKLALNGVYGDSNNKFSFFFDPMFTMSITITGQLLLSMLAELLFKIPDLRMIQANTDGLTVHLPRKDVPTLNFACGLWESLTGLQLEHAQYKLMAIRDVNNYIAVYDDGRSKRKGAYEYDLDWSQNFSALVVPKVACAVLTDPSKSVRELVHSWDNPYDFFLRSKVPRTGRLETHDMNTGEIIKIQNVSRYYVAQSNTKLVKVLPPLKHQTDERHFNQHSGFTVCVCNDDTDTPMPIDYEWYMEQSMKLVRGMDE